MTSKRDEQTRDPLIDEVREGRERLVREHGGLRGWVRHLQELQQEHPPKARFRGGSRQ